MTTLALRSTFFGVVPDQPKEDLLGDYLTFLERRNGSVATSGAYPNREKWLEQTERWGSLYNGRLDAAKFERNYTKFEPKEADPALLAVLAFVKVNAGEAYGVEVVTRHRLHKEVSSRFDQLERVLGNEETYHTRILLGASRQFGLQAPSTAYRPPLALKLLIGSLAYAPRALFHPILLASEVSGLFVFNWMLKRVGELFRDQPQLKETLEERLVEILIDEVGHVAFNRLAVGPLGMATARALTPHVASSVSEMTPELKGLGFTKSTADEVPGFELHHLPEEVLRRSFFA